MNEPDPPRPEPLSAPRPPGAQRLLAWFLLPIRRLAELARALVDRPREFPALLARTMRDGLVALWHTRGGGLYGIGWLVTFLILEGRMIVDEIVQADSVATFVESQAMTLLFRIGSQSFLNSLLSLLWPLVVLDHLGFAGIAVLIALWLGWTKIALPRVPERYRPLPKPPREPKARRHRGRNRT